MTAGSSSSSSSKTRWGSRRIHLGNRKTPLGSHSKILLVSLRILLVLLQSQHRMLQQQKVPGLAWMQKAVRATVLELLLLLKAMVLQMGMRTISTVDGSSRAMVIATMPMHTSRATSREQQKVGMKLRSSSSSSTMAWPMGIMARMTAAGIMQLAKQVLISSSSSSPLVRRALARLLRCLTALQVKLEQQQQAMTSMHTISSKNRRQQQSSSSSSSSSSRSSRCQCCWTQCTLNCQASAPLSLGKVAMSWALSGAQQAPQQPNAAHRRLQQQQQHGTKVRLAVLPTLHATAAAFRLLVELLAASCQCRLCAATQCKHQAPLV
jgi:hypothetical protein